MAELRTSIRVEEEPTDLSSPRGGAAPRSAPSSPRTTELRASIRTEEEHDPSAHTPRSEQLIKELLLDGGVLTPGSAGRSWWAS
jgi:hypothetical protein